MRNGGWNIGQYPMFAQFGKVCYRALSNLHLQPPYSLDAIGGMEMRVTGLTGAMRRFLALLRVVLPPDKVSVTMGRNGQRLG